MIEIILGICCLALAVAVIRLGWSLRYAMHRIESLDRSVEAAGNMTKLLTDRTDLQMHSIARLQESVTFIAQNLAPMAEAIERKADVPTLRKFNNKRNPNRPPGL